MAVVQGPNIDYLSRLEALNATRWTPLPETFSGLGGELTGENTLSSADALRNKYSKDTTVEQLENKYNVREFKEAPASSMNNIPVIELQAIDLSEYAEGPEGLPARQKLAAILEQSLKTYGFFNVVNWGFDQDKLAYLKAIAQSVLEVPEEEKLNYLAGARQTDLEDIKTSLGGERGGGYKPRGYWAMQKGVRDSIEHYNFRDMLHDDYLFNTERKYPEVARSFLPEVSEYYKYLHFQVLRKLCNLCDIILEKPEGFLWNNFFKVYKNDLVRSGGGFGRFMHYLGMKPEEESITENTWLRGHSDGTAFTFITSQPILSLQIRDYFTGEWRYVGHKPNSLIVNIGDGMEFLTGGYFKSSIHRVMSPPDDQKNYKREVLIYFTNPRLDTIIDPETLDSPKLQRLGFNKPDDWDKITFAEWDDGKGRLFGKKDINAVEGDEPLTVKLYGREHERWHQVEAKLV